MNKKIFFALMFLAVAVAVATATMKRKTKKNTTTTTTTTGDQHGVKLSSTDTDNTVPCIGGDCFYLV
jgi:hypothetical protein